VTPALPLVGIVLVVASSAVEGLGQVCLKQSATLPADKRRWLSLGIALFVVEALLYSGALQSLDISTAYPLGALSFVSVTCSRVGCCTRRSIASAGLVSL